MPGSFDTFFHSHNIFHCFVFAGAVTHYKAAMVFLRWRDVEMMIQQTLAPQ